MTGGKTMNLVLVQERTAELIEQLTSIWEESVKATHLFLSDSDIAEIKEFVPLALQGVKNLIVAVNDDNLPVGFMGVEEEKVEMLFIAPVERSKGIGKRFIDYGVKHFSIKEVTVNEQNPLAIGFYERMGFKVYKRTECDEQGRPFPLLYMKL